MNVLLGGAGPSVRFQWDYYEVFPKPLAESFRQM